MEEASEVRKIEERRRDGGGHGAGMMAVYM
jgi:hypothetical protein